MKDFGYRTELFSGSGKRNVFEVAKFEIFELGNLDILYTIINNNLVSNNDLLYVKDFISDLTRYIYFEDTMQDEAIYQVVSMIRRNTGFKITYCLWLADRKNVEYLYGKSCIDTYFTSSIVLSDLGKNGKLFAYENYPNKIN